MDYPLRLFRTRPPNPRLQRTRLRAPLSRKPLGVPRLAAWCVVVAAGACGRSIPADLPGTEGLLTPARYGPIQTYEGYWSVGFEQNSFNPCGSSEDWCVWSEADQAPVVRRRLNEVGGQALFDQASRPSRFYLHLRGQLTQVGRSWRCPEKQRELLVVNVVELRAVRPGDCSPEHK
jgi:hypothetical protein